MSLAEFIQDYGYLAVFVGTLLEGETILILAGLAAHRGYLLLPVVMATATVGSLLGDQLFFLLGQRYGQRLLQRFPTLDRRAARMRALLHRYHLPLILGIRFLYGLRTVGPMVIGMSHVSWPRFFALNLIGAIAWAVVITGSGYLFGHTLELMLADMKRYEGIVIGAIAALGVVFWLLYRWRQKRKAEPTT
jgi:membrane protein DedA with SNARE-associated domain